MFVGTRWADVNISECSTVYRLDRMVQNKTKKKTSSEPQFCGWKHLIDVVGQRRTAKLV